MRDSHEFQELCRVSVSVSDERVWACVECECLAVIIVRECARGGRGTGGKGERCHHSLGLAMLLACPCIHSTTLSRSADGCTLS